MLIIKSKIVINFKNIYEVSTYLEKKVITNSQGNGTYLIPSGGDGI